MKKLILLILLMSVIRGANAQIITLEHAYPHGATIFKTDASTSRYYSQAGDTLLIYSLSHILEKTILLHRRNSLPPDEVELVSKTLFNDDDKYEFLAGYLQKDNKQYMWHYTLYDEDGDSLYGFYVNDYHPKAFNTTAGAKLMMTPHYNPDVGDSGIYRIYSLHGKVYRTAIHEATDSQALRIYPNPARDDIHLAHGMRSVTTATLRIVNSLGQVVCTLPADLHNKVLDIPIYALPAGFYSVLLCTAQETRSGTFIVVH